MKLIHPNPSFLLTFFTRLSLLNLSSLSYLLPSSPSVLLVMAICYWTCPGVSMNSRLLNSHNFLVTFLFSLRWEQRRPGARRKKVDKEELITLCYKLWKKERRTTPKLSKGAGEGHFSILTFKGRSRIRKVFLFSLLSFLLLLLEGRWTRMNGKWEMVGNDRNVKIQSRLKTLGEFFGSNLFPRFHQRFDFNQKSSNSSSNLSVSLSLFWCKT